MSANPWTREDVALQQRALVDAQLAKWDPAQDEWMEHEHGREALGGFPQFDALVRAIKSTRCPGSLIELGSGSGYNREVLDRAGVEYRSYTGVDINATAIRIAKERYPESQWLHADAAAVVAERQADTVIDGSAMLHVEDWRAHLKHLCAMSRRWVILHRVALSNVTHMSTTQSYGQTFPAWLFLTSDVVAGMEDNGFKLTSHFEADHSRTFVFARPRHYASYCDAAFLPRLKALHASMVKHAGAFRLHVLDWSQGQVTRWAMGAEGIGPGNVVGVEDWFDDHPDLELDVLPGEQRTRAEHMFTCGPAWIADVMKDTGESCAYLDADLLALSSPEPMFAEVGGAPAGFVGHNFAPAHMNIPGPTVESHSIPFGRWNVGVLVFNDRDVVERWASLVKGWCFDRVELAPGEGGRVRFADQKYLEWLMDEWPDIVGIASHAAMVGPWNLNARALDLRDGVPHFGGKPIGFMHYSSMVLNEDGTLQRASRPEYHITQRQVDLLYRPYLAALAEASKS